MFLSSNFKHVFNQFLNEIENILFLIELVESNKLMNLKIDRIKYSFVTGWDVSTKSTQIRFGKDISQKKAKNFEDTLNFLFKAFMFGFVAYGTYNLTNMAALKDWSPSVVFVDMFWGASLTAFSSYYGILLAKKLLL